jgi:hypothetical protein
MCLGDCISAFPAAAIAAAPLEPARACVATPPRHAARNAIAFTVD